MRTIERGMARTAHPTAQPAIADKPGRINNTIPPARRDGIGALASRFTHFALRTA
ncbi:MAG: hypothetical protein KKG92_06325 [Gammaproteobacteria bacterium]|nr:hypothetical protein [Gammaproteobacteria bacterium]